MEETKGTIRPLVVRPIKAAVLLDMGKSSIYDAIHKGEIPAIRINGNLRVPMAAIEQLIAERLRRGDVEK
jgi:excisionase family DNA binding protein